MSSGDLPPHGDRWLHLVQAAFRVDEASAKDGASLETALAMVDSALEVFTSERDPLEDLEGFAVRRFLLAIRKAIASGGHMS